MILNKIKAWIVKPAENFKNFETHPYFICLPAYLSPYHMYVLTYVRPSSGGRMGPVFSYNTENQHANTDPLRLSIAPWWVFHHSLLPFLFDWWMKRWEITEEVLINCTGYIYVTLMAKCTCAWLHHLLKLLPSSMFLPCTDSSQPGWFNVETYVSVLRLVICQYTAAARIVIKLLWQ